MEHTNAGVLNLEDQWMAILRQEGFDPISGELVAVQGEFVGFADQNGLVSGVAQVQPIMPEPATSLLLALGAIMCLWRPKR